LRITKKAKYAVILTGLILFPLLIKFYPVDFSPTRIVKIHINDAEIINNKYMVFTRTGVFINRDSLINYKFNSGDIYGYLYDAHSSGKSMDCTALVNGYRVYWPISLYPNIITIHCE
jgi:hypothetical protein